LERSQVVLRDNVLEHALVEEDQGTQRLVLRGCGEAPSHDQVVEESFDVRGAELGRRLPLTVQSGAEGEELPNPEAVGVDVLRHALASCDDGDLVEQFHDA